MARSRSPLRTRFAVERALRGIDARRSTAEQVLRARSSQLPRGAYRAVVSRLSWILTRMRTKDREIVPDLSLNGFGRRILTAAVQSWRRKHDFQLFHSLHRDHPA